MKFVIFLLLSCLSLIPAHVSVSPSQIPNSGTTLLTFNIGHSCASDALTSKMIFIFPPNITSIKPVYKAGWIVNYTSMDMGYKTPAGVDAFSLIYTFTAIPGNEVPNWAVDTMLFRVTAPAAPYTWAAGSKFYVPIYQSCLGGLLNAWNTTGAASTSDSGALPAPSITILDPSAIQQIPTQSNVQALANQIAALTGTPTPTSFPNSSSSSSSNSDWLRADTISIIAIILAGLAILASILLFNKLHIVEQQNIILRKKIQSLNETPYIEKQTAQKEQSTPEAIKLTPVTNQYTTQPSTSEGHAGDTALSFQIHDN